MEILMTGYDYELKKHSIVISGHQTSVTLENIFWNLLKRTAKEKGVSLSKIISEIDLNRKGNLSSAIRIYIVNELLNKNE